MLWPHARRTRVRYLHARTFSYSPDPMCRPFPDARITEDFRQHAALSGRCGMVSRFTTRSIETDLDEEAYHHTFHSA